VVNLSRIAMTLSPMLHSKGVLPLLIILMTTIITVKKGIVTVIPTGRAAMRTLPPTLEPRSQLASLSTLRL
jgi:hypothetical protein